MKKRYKILIGTILAEMYVVGIMEKHGIKIQSWLGNCVAAIVFITPILIILRLISQDEDVSQGKRTFSIFVFWCIAFCCTSAIVVECASNMGILVP